MDTTDDFKEMTGTGLDVDDTVGIIDIGIATPTQRNFFIYQLDRDLDLDAGRFDDSLSLDGGTGNSGFTTVPPPDAIRLDAAILERGFNTLKNLGYKFEHNFGHGNQNLSNNLAVIMMLVFLIDQLQQLCCVLFQKAVKRAKRPSYLWREMRSFFTHLKFKNWDEDPFELRLLYFLKPAKVKII